MDKKAPRRWPVDPVQLLEFLRQLNRRRDLASLGQWLLEYAVRLVPGAKAGSFLVLDEERGVFKFRAAVGWDLKELVEIEIPKDKTVHAYLGHRQPAIVQDPIKVGQEILPPQVQQKLKRFPIAAFLTFPIVHEGEVIAYFNLDSPDDPDAFSQEDIESVAPLVEEVAHAVRLERERELATERDRLFQLVWNRLSDALFITDFPGRILECNPAAEQQTGYPRKELLSLNIMHDLAVEEPAITYERVNEQLARGETVLFEELKRRKDGTLYWTECAVVQFEYRGRPAVISVNRDITERKRLEEELRRRVKELRLLNQALELIPRRLELEKLVENAVAAAREATGADFAGMILFDPEGKPLRMFNPPGAPPIPLKMRRRGFLAWVLKTKRPLLVHETREDGSTEPPVIWPGETTPLPVHQLLLKLGVKSIVAIPIVREGRVTAILSLHSRRPRNFEGLDELLSALARQVDAALENALLYEKVKEQEKRFRHLFEESPVSLWVEDFSAIKARLDELKNRGVEDLNAFLHENPGFIGECAKLLRVVAANRTTLELYKANDFSDLLQRLPEVISPEAKPLLESQFLAMWEGKKEFEAVGVVCTLAGKPLTVFLRWRVFPGHEEHYDRVLVSIVDITARVVAERKLNVYAERLAALHQTVRALQRCSTEEEVCRVAVQGAARILGFHLCAICLVRGETLVPMAWVGDIRPQPCEKGEGLAWKCLEEQKAFWGDVKKLPAAKPVDRALRNCMSIPIGRLGVFQAASLEPGTFGEEDVRLAEILVGHINEEIQRVRLEEELRRQAIHDPLTGLYNRRHLAEALEREVSRAKRYGRPFAVMIVDLDNFKQVNDRYGHLGGDEVLKKVAQVLQESVRGSDLLFRYGGDEFVIVLPETDGAARRVAARLRKRLAKWAKKQGLDEVGLGLSIGVARWTPEKPLSVEDLLRRADAALYRAKRRKKLNG